MDVRLRELAARQCDVVAAWQLREMGWTPTMVKHWVSHQRWQVIHAGVFALTAAPLTRRQRWFAATLSAPGSVLSHASAGACCGFYSFGGLFETITRPGSGGPRRIGDLLVCRSRTLAEDVTTHQGIPITTAARTLIDLAAHVDDKATARAFREALRLKATTLQMLLLTLSRHRGRRGAAHLRELASRYGHLPYQRARSDAESRALEVLDDAELLPPTFNEGVAGPEADLIWPSSRQIIEIDGPQFHLFSDEDARKQARWDGAGYAVRRLPSDAVYDRPAELVELARRAVNEPQP